MARIDWIEQRLLNWARWRAGRSGGGLGYASVDLVGGGSGGRDGYVEASIPINDVEASATDDAIARLPSELHATVVEFYAGPGGEADHLRQLCCHRSTMHARIDRAHRLLAGHFAAAQDRQEKERQRVAELLAASRPRGGFTP